MTFPTGTTISETNFSSGSSDPSLARVDLLSLIQAVNDIIASANQAQGLPILTANGQIRSDQMPAEIRLAAGIQIIAPVDGIVNIRNIIRLAPRTVVQLRALEATAQEGDIAFCSDGDASGPCLALFTGLEWQIIRGMATIGDAPAALTGTATLACTAD